MTAPLFDGLDDDDGAPAPAPVDISGMVHRGDPHTSVEAAVAIAHRRTELHLRVVEAFAEHGHMTDEQLEELPEFRAYGPSTIRKRRSELYQQGVLVSVGDTLNSRGKKMLIWGLRNL